MLKQITLMIAASIFFSGPLLAQPAVLQSAVPTGSYSGLIEGIYSGAPANTSVDIGNNFWMIGSTPVDPANTSYYWPYFNFTASAPAVSLQSIPDYLTCGGGNFIKRKWEQPLSIEADTDSCGNAFGSVFLWEQNGYNGDSSFITMEWYIRHCYKIANAAQTWTSYKGAWGDTLNRPGMRDSIFNFVLSAISLRSDDEWFCFAVPLLGVKYVGANNSPDDRADRTILTFLMNNPRCADWRRSDSVEQADLLTSQWNLWADTSQPGEVFDSTIPTLHDIGLDTLLHFAADAVYPITTSTILLDARLEGNPTDADGLLWLSIGREAYLHINVYDLLGRSVQNAGYNGVFEQGTREIPLGMSNAPPGTYYVRIHTANNETKTLKLVKE